MRTESLVNLIFYEKYDPDPIFGLRAMCKEKPFALWWFVTFQWRGGGGGVMGKVNIMYILNEQYIKYIGLCTNLVTTDPFTHDMFVKTYVLRIFRTRNKRTAPKHEFTPY